MKVFVTGGCGFIGSNFVEHLVENNYDVTVFDSLTYAGDIENIKEFIDKNKVKFIKGDIKDYSAVKNAIKDHDVVYHVAAESHVEKSIGRPRPFFNTNILGTINVLDAVRREDIPKFVHISSCEVYGSARKIPMNEDHPVYPNSPYAASKAGADAACYAYYETYGVPVVIIRPFNQYGPRQHIEKVIPRFINLVLRKRPPTIHGSGLQTRDWTYIKDACEGFTKASETDKVGAVFNLGSGEEISILDVAKKIIKLCGMEKKVEPIFLGDRPGQVYRFVADTTKSDKILDWRAKTSFDDGLKKTIEWYKQRLKID